MDLFDLIKEMRQGKPDVRKAEKAMKVLGWICVVAAVWNFAVPFLMPFDKFGFNLPPEYPYLALFSLLLPAILFFRAANGIRELEPSGKKTGQFALVLLMITFAAFMVYVFPSVNVFPFNGPAVSTFFTLFIIVAVAQFCVPAYFGVRYLGRLPVKDDSYSGRRHSREELMRAIAERARPETRAPGVPYRDALLPIGVGGTFVLLLAVLMLSVLVVQKVWGPAAIPFVFIPAFLFLFLGPALYNGRSSPFEQGRTLLASYTGGGSVLLFHGSRPFFRLMVYDDGLEVRVMFHRFFIPYDKMGDIPDTVGFFSRGFLIKSDLPGVPSGIRFNASGMKEVLATVITARDAYLAKTKQEVHV